MTALPTGFVTVVVALFGLIFGSFLNVVIHRVPRRLSIVSPGSRCPECSAAIRWYHNLPVVSWILLRGRCAGCAATIPWRYPLVEIAAAGVVLAVFWTFGLSLGTAIFVPFCLAMLALFMIDFELQLLPFAITRRGTVAGLLLAPFNPRLPEAAAGLERLLGVHLDARLPLPALAVALAGALFGFGFLWTVATVYKTLTGIDGLGGGDPWLTGMIGAFTGPNGVLAVIVVASLGGALVGVAGIALRRATMRSALPFGCFLAPAAVAVALIGPEVLSSWNLFIWQHVSPLERPS